MSMEWSRILKSIRPLIISLFILLILLIFSFTFTIGKSPLWIKEGGIIETLSAIGYFLCAFLMFYKGKWAYIKKYNYLFMLVIFFGLRELDFDKRFSTMGIFKSKFYLSSSVPVIEKIIGLLVIAILIYIIISIAKNLSKNFFLNIKKMSAVHIGALLTFFLLLFTKTIDGIGRKLSSLGYILEEQYLMYFEILEEVIELGIPLLLISTVYIYFQEKNC